MCVEYKKDGTSLYELRHNHSSLILSSTFILQLASFRFRKSSALIFHLHSINSHQTNQLVRHVLQDRTRRARRQPCVCSDS